MTLDEFKNTWDTYQNECDSAEKMFMFEDIADTLSVILEDIEDLTADSLYQGLDGLIVDHTNTWGYRGLPRDIRIKFEDEYVDVTYVRWMCGDFRYSIPNEFFDDFDAAAKSYRKRLLGERLRMCEKSMDECRESIKKLSCQIEQIKNMHDNL